MAAVILLLLSPRAKTASIGFLLRLESSASSSRSPPSRSSPPSRRCASRARRTPCWRSSSWSSASSFCVLAAVQWRGDDARQGRPRAHTRLDARGRQGDPPIAFAVGFVMAVNPPNLLLSLAGGVAIGTSGLAGGGIVAGDRRVRVRRGIHRSRPRRRLLHRRGPAPAPLETVPSLADTAQLRHPHRRVRRVRAARGRPGDLLALDGLIGRAQALFKC